MHSITSRHSLRAPLALAWALALTRMRDAAPDGCVGACNPLALSRLLVMTSRTGWLYAAAGRFEPFWFFVFCLRRPGLARRTHAAIAGAVERSRCCSTVIFEIRRQARGGRRDCSIGSDLRRLSKGYVRASPSSFEGSMFGACLATSAADFSAKVSRLTRTRRRKDCDLLALRTTVETIAQHPLLGVGGEPWFGSIDRFARRCEFVARSRARGRCSCRYWHSRSVSRSRCGDCAHSNRGIGTS